MSSFTIKYQTPDTTPPPMAHAIEIVGKIAPNKDLSLSFELSYLNRELLSEEEILDEGYNLDTEFKWKGTLPSVWNELFKKIFNKSKPLIINQLEEFQEFWQVGINGDEYYPANTNQWKYFLEEIQQAVYEQATIEAPLKLTFFKITEQENYQLKVLASFAQRTFEMEKHELDTKQKKHKNFEWKELNYVLKNIFSGEFYADEATTKLPQKNGIFINLGDENWYELGKSWEINPTKVYNVMKMVN